MISDQTSNSLPGMMRDITETRRIIGQTNHTRVPPKEMGNSIAKRQRMFLTTIQSAGPNGEADYTDSRYWVKIQVPDNTAADVDYKSFIGSSPLDFTDNGNTWTSSPVWFTATNLAEWLLDTHTLPVGTPVVVMAIPEAAHSLEKWFVIVGSGGAAAQIVFQYQYQVWQAVAQRQGGADWNRFHAPV